MKGEVNTGRETNRNTKIKPAVSTQSEVEQISEQEMYRLILDSIHNGVMVTDVQGYVTHFNKPYGQFLGVKPEAQIGRHCTDVIENTRMHIVARTGRAEINQSHGIKGQKMVVQRIPIKRNGRVIAVFGQVMFKDVRDVNKLARKLSLLESKVQLYEEELTSLRSTRYTLDSIIGTSERILALKKEAARAAAGDLPVLITGESGTGKELFAQAIHSSSRRRTKPFVRINCAAIPRDLLESELFGYETGAFTGARSEGKHGKFELARGGTVFLDEIGDLPLEMQPKLLRVLEEKEFERVGGTSMIKADFRLLAASNQDLEQMLTKGSFRKDLYYRLNVIPIHIPPLRERQEDILALIRHYLPLANDGGQADKLSIEKRAERVLLKYNWPGNVRELFNVTDRIVHYLEGEVITIKALPIYLSRNSSPEPNDLGHGFLREAVAKAEWEAITYALDMAGGIKSDAARLLGIHRTLLYKKINKHLKASPDKADQIST
ncbi:MAG: sigma 54-interacting transcriptional regulator [Deltaproteobacteria bacterium]|nr:sigma 54-interacting transcriptional regulator [Deltaproteobacteria bacterium]